MWYNEGNKIKTRALTRVTSQKDVTLMTTPKYTSDIPYGYCHCGCGLKTRIIKRNDKRHGHIKGEPSLFLLGHQKQNTEVEFWQRVNKDGSIPAHCPELGNCWEWMSGTNIWGYGEFVFGKKQRCHRLSWIFKFGAIPDGLWVLHKCDNRLCVNPDHLWLGTNSDNIQDMVNKGRQRGVQGELHPHHKLTWKDVREIRRLYHSKQKIQIELAAQYSVSQRLISLIVRGEAWKENVD